MKMRSVLISVLPCLILILLSTTYSIAGVKGGKEQTIEKQVLATVGSEDITYGDLQQAFRKNMNRKDVNLNSISKDSITNFLKLYINYRLKVRDAIKRGYDQDSSVLADIGQNRKILAESFYYDKVLVDPAVENFLKRRTEEIQIAIILLTYDTRAAQPDTLKAYNKALDILNKIKKGEDFGQLAVEFSDDKESAKNKGVFQAYLTSGNIKRSIEDKIYEIKKEGDIYPNLIKTGDGYLIIKLIKRVPRILVKGKHILVSEGLDKDSASVIRRADSLIALLKKGAEFASIAEKNSDDPSTAMRGGDLGTYYSRSAGFGNTGKHFPQPMENALFEMKDGVISGKVFSELGIHILKRDSTKSPDVEADRDELRKLYKKLYIEEDKREHLDLLKKKYGFELTTNVLDRMISSLDTTKTSLDSVWVSKVPENLLEKPLFKVLKNETTVSEFIKTVTTKIEFKGTALTHYGFKKAIDKMVDPIAFNEASKNLEKDYPDFALLMKEFRDGILLFRVEAIEVWEKLKFDSTVARQFWDTTKTRFKTDPLYDISEIFVLTDTLAKEIYTKISSGEPFDTLAVQFTQRSGFREKKGAWGLVSAKKNKLAEIADKKNAKPGNVLQPEKNEKGYSIIKINKFEPIRQKTFEEAISDFAPEYQDLMQKKLSEKWITRIKEEFPVKINEKAVDIIFSKK